jgi:hypothetical protein
MMMLSLEQRASHVGAADWKRVGLFVGITYALTIVLDVIIGRFGGIGIDSLIILAGLVALLLRDPVWRCNRQA